MSGLTSDYSVPTLRMIAEIDFTTGFVIYADEIPPALLFRLCTYQSYECGCCWGGEEVVLSEHRTRPEAMRAAGACPDSWVEFWHPGEGGWTR